jgi:hypothetical protein
MRMVGGGLRLVGLGIVTLGGGVGLMLGVRVRVLVAVELADVMTLAGKEED